MTTETKHPEALKRSPGKYRLIGLEHIKAECDCGEAGCCFCDGGLFACSICNGLEGSLTRDCSAFPISADQADAIYTGKLDFFDGKWWVPKT